MSHGQKVTVTGYTLLTHFLQDRKDEWGSKATALGDEGKHYERLDALATEMLEKIPPSLFFSLSESDGCKLRKCLEDLAAECLRLSPHQHAGSSRVRATEEIRRIIDEYEKIDDEIPA